MKIIRAGFGNENEAFIETKFTDGVNIIYSNENNKGKTLLIQGILYAMGNEAIFPSGFPSDEYYFYTEIIIGDKNIKFLRKRNTIILLSDETFQICNSVSELKYFIKQNIFELPIIMKNNEKKVVDLSLYYQIFFIGQDKRNTSNIFNNGYYNKQDFFSMLCSINGYPLSDVKESEEDIDEEIVRLKSEIKLLKKMMKFVKDNPILSDYVNQSADKENFETLKKHLTEIANNISEYKKKRERAQIRKINLENLIGELRSISYNIKKGTVCCLTCGGKNISYTNGDVSFDVSNDMVRKQIMTSINEQILMEDDNIKEYSSNVSTEQGKLNRELDNVPPDLRSILLYSEDILSCEESDKKIVKLMNKITNLVNSKNIINKENSESLKQSRSMKNKIVEIMNDHYREVDVFGNIVFSDLFTKRDENYSGSEEQEFYYCKIMALNKYFNHSFPLIIDYYRAGELSSKKEMIMLNNYKKINKQVILTATLKAEEYDTLKYKELEDITAIDYSHHNDNKILQNSYVGEFNKIIQKFNVL